MDDLSNVDKEEQRDILDEAYLYITEGHYPGGCEEEKALFFAGSVLYL